MKLITLLFILFHLNASRASLIINEIAYSGSADQCNGEDWIEVVNRGPYEFDLSNITLHDDKGADDEDAKVFLGIALGVHEYKVFCKGVDFKFGIGSRDTVTLLDDKGFILSSVTLPGATEETKGDLTYAFFTENGSYKYTATPTPGATNTYTEPIPLVRLLQDQNKAGRSFFLNDMKPGGTSKIFDKVVDIYIDLDDENLAVIEKYPTYEDDVRFDNFTVYNANNGTAITNGGGGKMRTKGQSTLTITACLGLKNVPFQVEFDEPFYGMEVVYFRNHLSDSSYMREYASHVMLKEFGLPYLRCRPVRLFLNSVYVGFYTLIEAPTQAYVMQRSFGSFDPSQTALFKLKTMVADCPFTESTELNPYPDSTELEEAKNRDVPDPYYFDRGDHRADVPENADLEKCAEFFFEEIRKERADMVKGFVEYNQTCGLAMVKIGRVDRDFGPKTIEGAMIDFLDSSFYNNSLMDIKGSINADQWIKNFASYAVTVNNDSVMNIVNNWYLATTSGGVDDWRIVQYDHNNILSRMLAGGICTAACGPRMIYWPILRPTCRAVEDHIILGRVLNDEHSVQTYITYVEEFVGVLESGLLDSLRSYGHDLKDFIIEDPLSSRSMEEYEQIELGTDFDDYNMESSPFLKTLDARIIQVKAQLEAIKNHTLPRDGIYDDDELCPDWRDTDGGDYNAGSAIADGCPYSDCQKVATCYDNSNRACDNGEFVIPACEAISPLCDSCFPYSKCGAYNDNSTAYVESGKCGSNLLECRDNSSCFDHRGGICAFDGEILTEECKEVIKSCKSCYPYSRCGSMAAGITESSSHDINPKKTFIYVATIVTLGILYQ